TERWSGTSFAAPFVAAALLRSLRETGGDAAAARTLLAQDARDIGARGRDPIFGYGLLQVPPGDC
ncbi:MAG: S8 family serine peptidase, partial [Pseudomonadota bacterium]